MNKKFVVRLSEEERLVCQEVIKKLNGSWQKVCRAQILPKAEANGPGWTDAKIAEAFDCRMQTVENLRRRLVTEGFERALEGKKRQEPPTPPKLDGEGEAKLIALCLSKPPRGYGLCTLHLLAAELVALQVVDSISYETVRRVLKNGMTNRKIKYCVIPPERDAEFVAGAYMEGAFHILLVSLGVRRAKAEGADPNRCIRCATNTGTFSPRLPSIAGPPLFFQETTFSH